MSVKEVKGMSQPSLKQFPIRKSLLFKHIMSQIDLHQNHIQNWHTLTTYATQKRSTYLKIDLHPQIAKFCHLGGSDK